MGEHRMAIPHCYVWMCRDSTNRTELYWDYAKRFLKKNHPDMHLVRLEPVKTGSQPYVVCVKREKEE